MLETLTNKIKSPWERARFETIRLKRRFRYSQIVSQAPRHDSLIQEIKQNGFAIIRSAFDPEILLQIRQRLNDYLDAGIYLKPVIRDFQRSGNSKTFLSEDEKGQGQDLFRDKTNFAMIQDPLLHCPEIVPVAFSDFMLDVSSQYIGCMPALGTLNLRKSFVNSLPEFDTLLFHCDGNSPKMLKYFFYLQDTDLSGGPFCYVRGSHKKKFEGWKRKHRWSYEEVVRHYGENEILPIEAGLGDLIVADTTGFHRGMKPVKKDRCMLTLNYVIHPEFWGTQSSARIAKKDYESLSPKQMTAAQFLEVEDTGKSLMLYKYRRWRFGDVAGEPWEQSGKHQFNFLVYHGLKPNHRLLDIGCGMLRGGIHAIQYLEEGNYYGIDKEEELIKIALTMELDQSDLKHKKAHLKHVSQFDFEFLGKTKLDYVFAQSVFSHLTPDMIDLCLENITPHLHTTSKMFVTFHERPQIYISEKHPWRKAGDERLKTCYPKDHLMTIAARHGLTSKYLGTWAPDENGGNCFYCGYPHPDSTDKQAMMLFERT